jgi:MFS family permease
MNSIELKTALSLALIYATRMLGLFMILPVFTIYAENLEQVTPLLVGMTIGIYGLTQAILQIPFGAWSDRLGRKPVIIVGLLIFMLGSVVAASADSIYWVIIGRALQGAGAIASAIMALASDLTREQHRTKDMAIIGASIGASFMIALIIGPLLQGWIGVQGIFWVTAALAIISISIVALLIPTPVAQIHHATLDQATLKTVI